jgi:hypothetical protein
VVESEGKRCGECRGWCSPFYRGRGMSGRRLPRSNVRRLISHAIDGWGWVKEGGLRGGIKWGSKDFDLASLWRCGAARGGWMRWTETAAQPGLAAQVRERRELTGEARGLAREESGGDEIRRSKQKRKTHFCEGAHGTWNRRASYVEQRPME